MAMAGLSPAGGEYGAASPPGSVGAAFTTLLQQLYFIRLVFFACRQASFLHGEFLRKSHPFCALPCCKKYICVCIFK